MANPLRLTMFFGQAQTGWSETWWHPSGLNTAMYSRIQALIQTRVDMLTTNHYCIGARITEEGGNRFTRLILAGGETTIDNGLPLINIPGRGKEDGVGTNLEGPPDQVRAALHVEVIRGGLRIGLRYLAGIPDDISLTENPTVNKTWNKKWWDLFNLHRQRIIGDGWAIKTLDKGAAYPLINVAAWRIRNAAPSVLGVVIPLAQPFTHVVGQKVALQGVKMMRRGMESPNGTHIIDGVEENQQVGQRTVWLRGSEGYDPASFVTLGKVRAVADSYVQPSWLEPIRVGIHKRGKPFGSPVGRRTTR